MALYLTKYPDVNVSYDGTPLTVSDLITEQVDIDVPFENEYGPLTLSVIEWSSNVDRAMYLCDESGATLHERSEEHTSELQSLMRISYAVFCLKKKKTHLTSTTTLITLQQHK